MAFSLKTYETYMISKMQPNIDLESEQIGYTVEDAAEPSTGEKLKVYIPYLMQEIQKSNPKSSPVVTNGSSVFCNDASCKPLCQSQLTERNYLEAVREKNTSMEGIRESRDTKQGMLSGYNILKDTKLNFSFRKSLKNITFNTDDSEEEEDLTTLNNPIKVHLLSQTGSGGTDEEDEEETEESEEDEGGYR